MFLFYSTAVRALHPRPSTAFPLPLKVFEKVQRKNLLYRDVITWYRNRYSAAIRNPIPLYVYALLIQLQDKATVSGSSCGYTCVLLIDFDVLVGSVNVF